MCLSFTFEMLQGTICVVVLCLIIDILVCSLSSVGHLDRVTFTLLFKLYILSLSVYVLKMHLLKHILEMRPTYFLAFFFYLAWPSCDHLL